VAGLAEPSGGLHSTKNFLDPLTRALTDCVARMACGATVDGGATALVVLCHVRRDTLPAHFGDKLGGVISFVSAHVMLGAPPNSSTILLAASHSAVPVADVKSVATTRP
jgi:hypothetical protein